MNKIKKRILNYNKEFISENIDLILCYVILIISTLFAIVLIIKSSNPFLPVSMAFFSFLYIIRVDKFITSKNENFDRLNISSSKLFHKVNNILFFICIFLTLLTFFKFDYPHTINYLVIILSCCAFSILLSLFSYEKSFIVLFKIITLIVLLRMVLYYAFPVYGLDFYYHAGYVNEIYNYGTIFSDTYANYSYYSLYHILIVILKHIIGLSIRNIIFIIGFIQATILVSVIFLIGNDTFNRKVGLLSAFIYGIANELAIDFFIPNMFGLSIFTILVYLILSKKNIFTAILVIISILSLIFVHPYPMFNVILMMIALFAAEKFYNYLKIDINISLNTIYVGLTTITLALVAYIGYGFLWGTNELIRHSIIRGFTQEKTLGTLQQQVSSGIGYLNINLYNDLYMYLVVGFAIVGILIWLNKEKRSSKSLFLSFLTFFMLFGYFSIQTLNISFIPIPYRMVPFVFLPVTIAAAYGILVFSNSIIKKHNFSRTMVILICTALFFFSVTSSDVFPDSILFSGEMGYMNALNNHELSGLNFSLNHSAGNFRMDDYSKSYVSTSGLQKFNYNLKYFYSNSTKNFDTLLLRGYVLENPKLRRASGFKGNSTGKITLTEFLNSNNMSAWNYLYDNGDVWIFKKSSL